MKYYLCIDETGRFEHSAFVKAPSAVGGFFIAETGFNRLSGILHQTVHNHNARIASDERGKGILTLSKNHLHFRVLARSLFCQNNDDEIFKAVLSRNIVSENNIFVYLDWIRYLELLHRERHREIDREILSAIDKRIRNLGDWRDIYPGNLFAKWAAVLNYRAGNNTRALEILGTPQIPTQTESIFDVMDPLIHSLLARTISKEGPADSFFLEKISEVGSRYRGFKRFVEKRGLDRAIPSSVEEIARIMPYYYS